MGFYVTMKSRDHEWEERHVCLSDTGWIHRAWLSPGAPNPLKNIFDFEASLWEDSVDGDEGGWPWALERVGCCSWLYPNKPTVTRERAGVIGSRLGPKATIISAFLQIQFISGNPNFYPSQLYSLHLWRASGHEFIWEGGTEGRGGTMLITVSVNYSSISIHLWNTRQNNDGQT